jgi:hypothetical protein
VGLDNFIPAVWSGSILVALETAHRYAQSGVVNRDYEGEISAMGDRVKINSIGDVAIGNYVKNTDIADPEQLDDAQQELAIDQAKYFNFAVDDVDKAQTKPKVMGEAMKRSAYGLSNTADVFVAGRMAAAVPTDNLIGTEASPKTDLGTVTLAYDYLVDLGVLLDESDTPEDGRWVIVPPWFHGILNKDDRFVKSGTPAGDAALRNGRIGEAAGFTVLKSNNVPSTTATTKFKIIAGHDMATSYAEQLNEVEAYRPEKRFSDAVKGLHLYGGKVVRPVNLAMLIANKP